jgi:transcriptional regulator with XRE-family HTH domain
MSMSAPARLAQHLQHLTRPEMAALSEQAGVPRRLGARARAGRKVGASAYILLCIAVGVDPATGRAAHTGNPRAGFSIAWWTFGSALFLTRSLRRLDLRSTAQLVGVSAATLSRAERGQPIAIESYLSITDFIGLPPQSFLCFTFDMNCNRLMTQDSRQVRSAASASVGQIDANIERLSAIARPTECEATSDSPTDDSATEPQVQQCAPVRMRPSEPAP